MEDRLTRDVFDDVCKNLKIDKSLIKKLIRYKVEFITKSEEYSEFFGGNLIGCYNVRFTDVDREKWFGDILNIDESQVDKRLDKLIPKKYLIVAGDNMNISCVWLAHSIYNSKLSDKDKEVGMAIAMEVMQYKFITSRLWQHWRYTCSKIEAENTIAKLSNKYSIKRKGSWNNVIHDRALDIINVKSSIHNNTIKYMDKDYFPNGSEGQCVAYLINDTQSRIRDMLKNIYNVFITNHKEEKMIQSDNKMSTFDGEEELKTEITNQSKYIQYINAILPDYNSFMKSQLYDVIVKSNTTMSPKYLRQSLEYISKHYNEGSTGIKLATTVNNLMEYTFSYLSTNNEFTRKGNDLSWVLGKMKGIISSSRAVDENLFKIRKDIEDIVKIATKTNSKPNIAATRTGVILYIVLRTLTMSYFS